MRDITRKFVTLWFAKAEAAVPVLLVGSNDNSSGLYSGDAKFESRVGAPTTLAHVLHDLQSLQENVGILPQIKQLPDPSTSLPVHAV
jgi:hypothetical protein